MLVTTAFYNLYKKINYNLTMLQKVSNLDNIEIKTHLKCTYILTQLCSDYLFASIRIVSYLSETSETPSETRNSGFQSWLHKVAHLILHNHDALASYVKIWVTYCLGPCCWITYQKLNEDHLHALYWTGMSCVFSQWQQVE